MKKERVYIAIDLKSFYASVECVERDLDPLDTNLVVADLSRTKKTICLAVSPSLKAYGIPGRARLFEVVQKVKEANEKRRRQNQVKEFDTKSHFASELSKNPKYAIDYIVAPPRMALYMKYSTRIYDVYLKYVSPEDIHVYSIDEVFMDVTDYLMIMKMTPEEMASKIVKDVYQETKITATAGIGSNLYLCKVAMDIVAKHVAPNKDGVRIARLDEMSYRRLLWGHKPITDFWRVGKGYKKKLEEYGLFTMGDIARCSLGGPNDFHNEDLLFKLFGVNAELLIDHAWGYEPTTIAGIKAYKPSVNCLSSGQVLQSPYEFEKGKLIVREMTDLLVLDLVEKRLVTDQIVLTIGYDIENLTDPERSRKYNGEITIDYYGRQVPKHAHGTINLGKKTSSTKLIMDAVMELYDDIVDKNLLVRRVTIVANRLEDEKTAKQEEVYQQLNLFSDFGTEGEKKEAEKKAIEEKLQKERRLQEAMLSVKKKYGKNAMLKGMNLEEGAMTMERNRQIGGHKA